MDRIAGPGCARLHLRYASPVQTRRGPNFGLVLTQGSGPSARPTTVGFGVGVAAPVVDTLAVAVAAALVVAVVVDVVVAVVGPRPCGGRWGTPCERQGPFSGW